ncbi:MAG: CAP domain-containing protein [Bdellovibrionia bacterium]
MNRFFKEPVWIFALFAATLLSSCGSQNASDPSRAVTGDPVSSDPAMASTINPSPTPTRTRTATPSPSPTITATPTPTRTASPTPTATPTTTPTKVPTATPTTGTGSGSGLTGSATLDSEEVAFLGLINDYRAQNGLAPLQVSVALTQASDWMSTDMASKNYFSHTDLQGRDPFVRMAAFNYNYSWAGENIAAGNATAQATFTQWKNSPGHNANMLNANYKVIGIGRAQNSSSTYNWYWTTDFGGTVDTTVSF